MAYNTNIIFPQEKKIPATTIGIQVCLLLARVKGRSSAEIYTYTFIGSEATHTHVENRWYEVSLHLGINSRRQTSQFMNRCNVLVFITRFIFREGLVTMKFHSVSFLIIFLIGDKSEKEIPTSSALVSTLHIRVLFLNLDAEKPM